MCEREGRKKEKKTIIKKCAKIMSNTHSRKDLFFFKERREKWW